MVVHCYCVSLLDKNGLCADEERSDDDEENSVPGAYVFSLLFIVFWLIPSHDDL